MNVSIKIKFFMNNPNHASSIKSVFEFEQATAIRDEITRIKEIEFK